MNVCTAKNFDLRRNSFYLPPGTKGEFTICFLANPPISAAQVQWILPGGVKLHSGQEGKIKAGNVTRVPVRLLLERYILL